MVNLSSEKRKVMLQLFDVIEIVVIPDYYFSEELRKENYDRKL